MGNIPDGRVGISLLSMGKRLLYQYHQWDESTT